MMIEMWNQALRGNFVFSERDEPPGAHRARTTYQRSHRLRPALSILAAKKLIRCLEIGESELV